LPDPELAITHVWAEGASDADARRLVAIHAGQVAEIPRSSSNPLGTLPPMNIPEDLRYSPEHEWIRVTGSVARIGITDFAQDSLGDVVFVQLPDVGLDVVAGGGGGAG